MSLDTGNGLAFFKVHNKADHFDRTYDTLTTIWQQQPETVKTAFAFIGQHQLAMWQWLSDAVESEQ
ncbi:MAG: hypothetical protein GY821_04615 [Gammaproteobacteria bacterium]|nr:hypothetical protein [Gammaproteobacteria bacterium]